MGRCSMPVNRREGGRRDATLIECSGDPRVSPSYFSAHPPTAPKAKGLLYEFLFYSSPPELLASPCRHRRFFSRFSLPWENVSYKESSEIPLHRDQDSSN
ncbi:hypothetical protein KSP40_PGU010614 [Platanthera guangdongensis]|uniref:Uncharacterized protein n=1 Tax=Platanthera guangdongensis TaxID=2320717 RepID=A0ABR2LXE2_9ASPA